jgi:hypothetical protein
MVSRLIGERKGRPGRVVPSASWDPQTGAGYIALAERPEGIVSRFKSATVVLDYDADTDELVGVEVIVGPWARKQR